MPSRLSAEGKAIEPLEQPSDHPSTPPPMPATTDSSGSTFAGWWRSDHGPGPLLQLAIPLMLSTGLVSLTLFTDRTLLYMHSEMSASAAMGAGSVYWFATCLPSGMLGYVSTFVAQYRGAGQHQRVGAVYRHAIWLAWITVPAMLLVMVLAGYIFHWAGHAKTLADLEADYLRYLMIGGLATLFYSVQSGLLTGQGNTGTVLVIDVIATILNLVLTYLLIFGNSWLPEMGVKGAAIATSISFWIKLPLAHWAIHRHPTARQLYALDRSAPLDLKLIGRIINFGAPAGFQMLAESGCFVIIIMQVGNLGELPMAASTLALSLNTMAFVPMLGLGIATSVLVGEHITDGRLHLAKRTATISIATSVLYTSFFVIALGLFAQTTSLIYSWGTEPERFARIQPLLVPLLQIIGLYCVFDGLQIAFVGAIKGAGDTWFVLAATAAISVLVVSSGLLLQSQLGNSLLLWWWVIFGWVVAMAIVFSARYFSGAWESKRVID